MRPSHHASSLLGPLVSIGILLLLAVAVAALVWWLLRRRKATKDRPGFRPQPHWQPGAGPGPHPGPPTPQPPLTAVQILDERLARGDIEVDDYLTRRAALTGDRPANGTEFQHDQTAPTDPPDTPS